MTTTISVHAAAESDAAYIAYVDRVAENVSASVRNVPLFTTDATGLWDAYLAALPEADRASHTCRACQKFVERYGGLVTIAEDGLTTPVVWSDETGIPELYIPCSRALRRLIGAAKVTGVFLSAEQTLGQSATGSWHHLHAKCPPRSIHIVVIKTAGQAMAEKREDYKNVTAALDEFTGPVILQALTLLETELLYRNEKVVGPVKWLRDLQQIRSGPHTKIRQNVTWLAVATAPAGFCHPRSSMTGTLLEDIAAGLSFDEVSRRFAAKMHPLSYQRPQAPPKSGTIVQAEKIVEQLGAAGSLARRYCGPDEVTPLWASQEVDSSTAPAIASSGVFSDLIPKRARPTKTGAPADVPAVTMTWEKFRRTVLSKAEKIEFYAGSDPGNYCTLVTAVNPESPPILQWDRDEGRNPVSWYVYPKGSLPGQYGLSPGWIDVYAVVLKPNLWGDDPLVHQGEGVLFLLTGARETNNVGSAIFPEMLRTEFHGIRSVIEAHSRKTPMQDIDGAHAIGLVFAKGDKPNLHVRVTSADRTVLYRLDRWD